MKRIIAAVAALFVIAAPAFAGSHRHHSFSSPYSTSGGYAAGPGDSDRRYDYSAPVGSRDDTKLSTGWTTGRGSRTEHVNDYWRHNTRSNNYSHVHSYYRR